MLTFKRGCNPQVRGFSVQLQPCLELQQSQPWTILEVESRFQMKLKSLEILKSEPHSTM